MDGASDTTRQAGINDKTIASCASYLRSGLKLVRISSEKSCGCSQRSAASSRNTYPESFPVRLLAPVNSLVDSLVAQSEGLTSTSRLPSGLAGSMSCSGLSTSSPRSPSTRMPPGL